MSHQNLPLEKATDRNCGTCKHRGDDPVEAYRHDADYNDLPVTYYECKRVTHGNSSRLYDEKQMEPGHGALVMDGSGYRAKLAVENTFCCALWEAK